MQRWRLSMHQLAHHLMVFVMTEKENYSELIDRDWLVNQDFLCWTSQDSKNFNCLSGKLLKCHLQSSQITKHSLWFHFYYEDLF